MLLAPLNFNVLLFSKLEYKTGELTTTKTEYKQNILPLACKNY